MKNSFKKIISILVVAIMALSLSSVAFADPVSSTSIVEETTAVRVCLYPSDYDSSNPYFDDDAPSYKAIKLLDLYKVMEEVEGVTQQVEDGNGKPIYQYRIADEGIQDVETVLSDAGFAFDDVSGSITMANGDAITSMSGVNENSSNAAKLATLLAHAAIDDGLTGTEMKLGTVASLESGYYVIYQESGSNPGAVATKPILVDVKTPAEVGGVVPVISITLKDASVSLTKEIIKNNVGYKETGVSVWDQIKYRITTNFPTYEADAEFDDLEFVITDWAPNHDYATYNIPLNGAQTVDPIPTINVYLVDEHGEKTPVAKSENTYTITDLEPEDDDETDWDGMQIDFNDEYVLAHQGDGIIIEYYGRLNENAQSNSNVNVTSECTVEYSDNPEDPNSTSNIADYTNVYTYAFNFSKIDGDTENFLEGAKFVLYKSTAFEEGYGVDGNGLNDITYNGGPYFPYVGDDGNAMLFYEVDASGNYHVYDFYFDGRGEACSPSGKVVHPDQDCYYKCQIETNDEGSITIYGIGPGTYYLYEAFAPAGYAKSYDYVRIVISDDIDTTTGTYTGAADITVTGAKIIDNSTPSATATTSLTTTNNGTSNVDLILRNYKGVTLPNTGSISAITMSIAGAIATLGGCVFVVKKKKKED